MKVHDWAGQYILEGKDSRDQIKNFLEEAVRDKDAVRAFKASPIYRLIINFCEEKKRKAEERAYAAINNPNSLTPDQTRDEVFLRVLEMKAESDLLAFFGNTVELGEAAENQLSEIAEIDKSERFEDENEETKSANNAYNGK